MSPCATFHFLNVGRGDCIVVQHHLTGNVTMVDINNGTDLEDYEFDEIVESVRRSASREATFRTTLQQAQRLEAEGVPAKRAWRTVLQPYWAAILRAKGCELQNPIEYLAALGVTTIFRMIVTHPDADHFTGLHALDGRIAEGKLSVLNFWHIGDMKEIDAFESDEEQESWITYRKWQAAPFNRSYRQGATNKYFNQDDTNGRGDGLYVLSPDEALLTDAHRRFGSKADIYNNASFVLLFVCGKSRVVLGGDAFGNRGSTSPADAPQDENMPNAWRHILNSAHYGYPANQVLPGVTLLKASHHGLRSGYHDEAVPMMNPKVSIISEGPKTDTDAQHLYPNETMSTRLYGNIVADVYDDGQIFVWTQRSQPQHGSTDTKNGAGYFLNGKSVVNRS